VKVAAKTPFSATTQRPLTAVNAPLNPPILAAFGGHCSRSGCSPGGGVADFFTAGPS
jgi:hypothetical protein